MSPPSTLDKPAAAASPRPTARGRQQSEAGNDTDLDTGSENADPQGGEEASARRLSEAEAEQFAASFRPSWHGSMPPQPAVDQRLEAAESHPGDANGGKPAPHSSAPPASRPEPEPEDIGEEAAAMHLARTRRRAAVGVGGVVAGFLVMAALGVLSSDYRNAPNAPTATSTSSATGDQAPPDQAPPDQALPEAPPEKRPSPPSPVPTASAQGQPNAAPPAGPSAQASPPEPGPAPQPAPGPDESEDEGGEPAAPRERRPQPGQGGPDGTAALSLPEPKVDSVPDRVTLQVRVTPQRARLRVDGRRVENPYNATREGGGVVKIRATAAGYQPREFTLALDRNRTLAISLRRETRD